MKIPKSLIYIVVCIFCFSHLQADPRICTGNDTIVSSENAHDLMKYLEGTWSVAGSWMILEGQGKIKKEIKTRIVGTEVFTPILNGHFLEKKIKAKVKYHSRDLDKIIQNPFSAMTIMTFNANLGKFFYWFYDSNGSFLEANGSFNKDQSQYIFQSKMINESGKDVENIYTITIVDPDHYRWEVKQKEKDSSTWIPGASGLSTRKKD